MHAELEALLEAVGRIDADARALVGDLTDAQVNWRPEGGARWSIAQCLDHLAKTNRAYTEHFLPVVERARAAGVGPFRGLRPSWFGKTFVRVLEPPVRQRARAFKRILPAPELPRDEALTNLLASHQAFRGLVRAASEVDVNRVRAANPFVPLLRMRVATALQAVPAHDRRHLWQARQVLARPEFPRP